MCDSCLVLVIENNPLNALDEARIQLEERKNVIDEIDPDKFGCWLADDFHGLSRYPFFILNSVTGEFRNFIGESQEYREAVVKEWIENFKTSNDLTGSGYNRYVLNIPIKSWLITEVNND